MSYKIKSGKVPFPETRGRASKYPFEGMEVGDYFDVPITDLPNGQRSLSSNAIYWSKKLAVGGARPKYSIRTMSGVVRVKRIE